MVEFCSWCFYDACRHSKKICWRFSIVGDLSELVRENKVFKMGSYLIPHPELPESDLKILYTPTHQHIRAYIHTDPQTSTFEEENQFPPKTIRWTPHLLSSIPFFVCLSLTRRRTRTRRGAEELFIKALRHEGLNAKWRSERVSTWWCRS